MPGWASPDEHGCAIRVRVVPRASRAGVIAEADGVTVRVHAAPVGGRATAEAADRLAEALGVARSRVTLRTGGTSRTKTYVVRGVSPREAVRRLTGTA